MWLFISFYIIGAGVSRKRKFDVLLICGASGTGKSTIAYQLGKYYKMNIVQVDDFQCIIESATKEIDYPVFHYWNKHFEEAIQQPINKKLEIMISYANTLAQFLEIVIFNHLEENRPMIIEGDFISPDLCHKLQNNPEIRKRIKCILITEDSKEQIIKNYQQREGSIQEDRAELSSKYNSWLYNEALKYGIKNEPSRPWKSLRKRIVKRIEE
ncbi:hypothetical protein BS795_24030 [Salmonella enterica]|nr:hypothetical protein [Salmonella enterica]EAX9633113.1 hypothetical protein [Salmonella enterica]EAX9677831.1 hypothetical protein [Salmonella enterica]EAZ2071861.1 hypothetical protein [Salmonella enterica]EAZ2072113.1 hypothetical protein [Salmonella enterica]